MQTIFTQLNLSLTKMIPSAILKKVSANTGKLVSTMELIQLLKSESEIESTAVERD